MSDEPNKLQQLIAALLDPCNGVETVLMQLFTERAVDTASGVRLDAIGAIVGQARLGLEDDDYRRFVRARIATSKSSGKLSDIYKVARLILDDAGAILECSQQPPAAVVLRVSGVPVSDDLAEILAGFLRDLASAGVRTILEYTLSTTPNIAHFDLNVFDGTVIMSPAIE